MEDEMMATIDKLRNEVAATKDDMLSGMEPEAMEPYIWNLLTDYYYSYVNDDMDKFHTVDAALVEAIAVAYEKCANTTNYINYCRISIMTTLLNKLFKRDESLEMPEGNVSIDDVGTMDRRLYEELTDAIRIGMAVKNDDEYFKNLEVEMMDNGDYVKHLIRPDVDHDFINSNIHILEDILTTEGMTVIKHYMEDRRE